MKKTRMTKKELRELEKKLGFAKGFLHGGTKKERVEIKNG